MQAQELIEILQREDPYTEVTIANADGCCDPILQTKHLFVKESSKGPDHSYVPTGGNAGRTVLVLKYE